MRIIACDVLRDELEALRDPGLEVDYVDQDLHNRPEALRAELQKRIDAAHGGEDIVLAFGACGGATQELVSPVARLVIPRVYDCIGLLMGAQGAFEAEQAKAPGTYYLSTGWVRGGASMVAELNRAMAKYGASKGVHLVKLALKHYQRVLFIESQLPTPETTAARQTAAGFASTLNLALETREGSPRLLKKMVSREWDEEFRIFAAGEPIRDSWLTAAAAVPRQ